MKTRYTIKDMQELAAFHGGKCLSKEYWGNERKLSWMCAKGHTWDAFHSIVKQGGWCPQCYKEEQKEEQKQQKLEVLRQIAKERGGECLSKVYVNSISKLLFQCSEGHKWKAIPEVIKNRGNWCSICLKEKKNKQKLEELKQIANQKGGKCLSEFYINNYTELFWQCSEGHRWDATPKDIKNNDNWCSVCFKENVNKPKLEELKQIAKERGGKCLSDTYINCMTKLLWQCSNGHKWEAVPNEIKNGNTWCPVCNGNKVYVIDDMKEHAKIKGGKCLSKKYIGNHTKLLWQCSEGHKWESSSGSVINGKTWCPYCAGHVKLTIDDMKVLAKEKGGKCLSKIYINSKTKLLWQCSKGHKWEADANNVKSNKTWCPFCVGKVSLTIDDMKVLAKEKGGKCLSKIYINSKTKLLWQCSKGHKWEATPHSVKNSKTWCPHCYGHIKHTIEQMKEIAEKKGGKCLSNDYKNAFVKLLWECAEGHKWEAKPIDVINRNTWCPYCAGKRKLPTN